MIRRCRQSDLAAVREIINDAAQAYRGVIPPDCWHEPYMPESDLTREMASGVVFWGYEDGGALVGVMGIQDVDVPGSLRPAPPVPDNVPETDAPGTDPDVTLVRHAYVRTERRRQGIGGELLRHLLGLATRPVLVGTWKAATWAVSFYEKHGFRLVGPEHEKSRLLRTYWDIPERQVETSVVLAEREWPRAGEQA